jgi:hypothetical protein
MAEKKSFMVGNIRLSDLNGFEDTVKQGVRGFFVPYDQNPSLYIGQNRQTGAMTVDMDILIRETKSSKSGSTHFIKLSVGKANRERFQMSQEAADSLKIVGNLYTRYPGQGPQGTAAPQGGYPLQNPSAPQGQPAPYPAPQGGGYPGGAPQYGAAPRHNAGFEGDMPDFSAPGAQGAGW